MPARQNLAAALMAADRAAEAETVLWEDLKRNPEHGWTLALLSKALKLQDKAGRSGAASTRDSRSPGRGRTWRSRRRSGNSHGPFTQSRRSRRQCRSPKSHSANGVRLHYARQGPPDGPAIILLHGYSDSSFSFSRVMPLLPPELRVIAPDLRGHGRFGAAGRAAIVSADFAGDVLRMMDALNIPEAIDRRSLDGQFRGASDRRARAAPRVEAGASVVRAAWPTIPASVSCGARSMRFQILSTWGSCASFSTARSRSRCPRRSWTRRSRNSRRMPAHVWRTGPCRA